MLYSPTTHTYVRRLLTVHLYANCCIIHTTAIGKLTAEQSYLLGMHYNATDVNSRVEVQQYAANTTVRITKTIAENNTLNSTDDDVIAWERTYQ
jgi:hypothetical protein